MQPAYKPAVLYLGYYELAYIAIVFAIKFHIMKNEIWVEGRGLEALYNYLQEYFTVDCEYKFNHWFLYAEISKIIITGEEQQVFSRLVDYYANRKMKDVVVTISGIAYSFKDKTIEQIIEEVATHVP
jgi:hypothetical protein